MALSHLSTTTLQLLECQIGGPFAPSVEPMAGDKWLVSSAMQKAIRRGDTEIAERAAHALWLQDRQSFWRRLHIVSIEDVGIVNPGLIVEVLTATASSIWRRRIGDLRVGLFLIRKLCESAKTRIGDEVLLQAERASIHAAVREHMATASDETLCGIVADEDASLIERCLGVWYLAGMKRYPSDLIPNRRGQPEDAAEILRTLNVPADLLESCIGVMGRTQWPLAIFTPLIWQEAKKHTLQGMRQETFEPMPQVNGVPLYAADIFTRTGGAAFRRIQKELPALKTYTARQIGIGTFYREGGLLDKVATSPFFDEYRQAGELADAEGNGMPVPEYLGLRECLDANVDLLNSIRTDLLERYFDGAASCAA